MVQVTTKFLHHHIGVVLNLFFFLFNPPLFFTIFSECHPSPFQDCPTQKVHLKNMHILLKIYFSILVQNKYIHEFFLFIYFALMMCSKFCKFKNGFNTHTHTETQKCRREPCHLVSYSRQNTFLPIF